MGGGRRRSPHFSMKPDTGFKGGYFCPEGAFCVGRLKKKGVRSSDRPSARTPSVPCALATNQQILGKNLEIRGFSVNFDLNHQKLKTCVLGEWIRIEE